MQADYVNSNRILHYFYFIENINLTNDNISLYVFMDIGHKGLVKKKEYQTFKNEE